ncbi:MAG: hypothetical protein LBT89_05265 [Planctomycetaceae bacterium]|nr:hypothetical protein [Planctomycetaceae bacterium]
MQKIADAAGIALESAKPIEGYLAVKPKSAVIKENLTTEPATAIPPLDKGYTEWLHKQSR